MDPVPSLPPQVEGPILGEVMLLLGGISWKFSSQPQFPQVRVLWWGDSGHGSLLRPANPTDEELTSMSFPIRVGAQQLGLYFNDASALSLDIVNEKTHKVLGTAEIPLPAVFKSRGLDGYFPIVSLQDEKNVLGEIEASLNIIYYDEGEETLVGGGHAVRPVPDDVPTKQAPQQQQQDPAATQDKEPPSSTSGLTGPVADINDADEGVDHEDDLDGDGPGVDPRASVLSFQMHELHARREEHTTSNRKPVDAPQHSVTSPERTNAPNAKAERVVASATAPAPAPAPVVQQGHAARPAPLQTTEVTDLLSKGKRLREMMEATCKEESLAFPMTTGHQPEDVLGDAVGTLVTDSRRSQDLLEELFFANKNKDLESLSFEPVPESRPLKSTSRSETEKASRSTSSYKTSGAARPSTTLPTAAAQREDAADSDDELVDIVNNRQRGATTTGAEDFEVNEDDKVIYDGLSFYFDARSGQNMSTSRNSGYYSIYLSVKLFGKETASSGSVFWANNKPKFNFEKCVDFPLTLANLAFVQKSCLVVEVWKQSTEGQISEELVGLAKVPLSSLYAGLAEPNALDVTLSRQFPLVAHEGPVSIVDPFASQERGQLNLLIAIGSRRQIANVRARKAVGILQNVPLLFWKKYAFVLMKKPEDMTDILGGNSLSGRRGRNGRGYSGYIPTRRPYNLRNGDSVPLRLKVVVENVQDATAAVPGEVQTVWGNTYNITCSVFNQEPVQSMFGTSIDEDGRFELKHAADFYLIWGDLAARPGKSDKVALEVRRVVRSPRNVNEGDQERFQPQPPATYDAVGVCMIDLESILLIRQRKAKQNADTDDDPSNFWFGGVYPIKPVPGHHGSTGFGPGARVHARVLIQSPPSEGNGGPLSRKPCQDVAIQACGPIDKEVVSVGVDVKPYVPDMAETGVGDFEAEPIPTPPPSPPPTPPLTPPPPPPPPPPRTVLKVSVESAIQLPRVAATPGLPPSPPNTFVLYKFDEETPQIRTPVANNSTCPTWCHTTEVDLVKARVEDSELLEFSIWHTDVPEEELNSDTFHGESSKYVGSAYVDLQPLSHGLSEIWGWYDVVDFKKQSQGQIKLRIVPTEDMKKSRSRRAERLQYLVSSSTEGGGEVVNALGSDQHDTNEEDDDSSSGGGRMQRSVVMPDDEERALLERATALLNNNPMDAIRDLQAALTGHTDSNKSEEVSPRDEMAAKKTPPTHTDHTLTDVSETSSEKYDAFESYGVEAYDYSYEEVDENMTLDVLRKTVGELDDMRNRLLMGSTVPLSSSSAQGGYVGPDNPFGMSSNDHHPHHHHHDSGKGAVAVHLRSGRARVHISPSRGGSRSRSASPPHAHVPHHHHLHHSTGPSHGHSHSSYHGHDHGRAQYGWVSDESDGGFVVSGSEDGSSTSGPVELDVTPQSVYISSPGGSHRASHRHPRRDGRSHPHSHSHGHSAGRGDHHHLISGTGAHVSLSLSSSPLSSKGGNGHHHGSTRPTRRRQKDREVERITRILKGDRSGKENVDERHSSSAVRGGHEDSKLHRLSHSLRGRSSRPY